LRVIRPPHSLHVGASVTVGANGRLCCGSAALEDGDARVFLLALRNVPKARGFSTLATKSALNRESLYKMLSKRGNPSLRSLGSLLDSLGFRLSVSSKDAAYRRMRPNC